MSQETLGLGKIITGPQERDAIHIAVLPVVAAERLRAGDWISLDDNGEAFGTDDGIGIVDPFLKGGVRKGQRFWMYLTPGSIKSLRHLWTHPACPDNVMGGPKIGPIGVAAAKAEIEAIALGMGSDGAERPEEQQYYGPRRPMTYARLMAAAEEWLLSGDRHVQQGSDNWRDGEFPHERFWTLYAVITGESVPEEKNSNFFCCTC